MCLADIFKLCLCREDYDAYTVLPQLRGLFGTVFLESVRVSKKTGN